MLPLTHGRRRPERLERGMAGTRQDDIRTHVRGPVPRTTLNAVTGRLRTLLPRLPGPALFVRVKLTALTSPGVTWPAIGQVNLDLPDRTVRAQVAAGAPAELADLLPAHLHARVGDLPYLPTGHPRHWSAQLNHLADAPPGAGERAVLRRKAYRLGRLTVDEAVTELEELDYDAHLFAERTTGQDAVVYHVGDGFRLALSGPAVRSPVIARAPVTVSRRYPSTLTLAAAKAQIDALGLPFLFFLDSSNGRGAMLYHRYDGHFGVVTAIG